MPQTLKKVEETAAQISWFQLGFRTEIEVPVFETISSATE